VILSVNVNLIFGQSSLMGIFPTKAGIGSFAKPGPVNFNPKNGEYLIAGGGENIWLTNAAFYFCAGFYRN
jgi:hypothetical protein